MRVQGIGRQAVQLEPLGGNRWYCRLSTTAPPSVSARRAARAQTTFRISTPSIPAGPFTHPILLQRSRRPPALRPPSLVIRRPLVPFRVSSVTQPPLSTGHYPLTTDPPSMIVSRKADPYAITVTRWHSTTVDRSPAVYAPCCATDAPARRLVNPAARSELQPASTEEGTLPQAPPC